MTSTHKRSSVRKYSTLCVNLTHFHVPRRWCRQKPCQDSSRFLVWNFDQFEIFSRISAIRLQPFGFLIIKVPKPGKVPTLEGWYEQSACIMWYKQSACSRVHMECLYQTCSTWTGRGQERSVYCFRTGNILTQEACPCSRLYIHDKVCSRLEQVVQPLKWDYKAMKILIGRIENREVAAA